MTDYIGPLTERQKGHLPDLLGIEWLEARPGYMRARFEVKQHHMAPNGFLHAASVIALADSACGYGCVISKPEAAIGFTTIELKSNFLGTARDGAVTTEATLTHGGRTTQVWDAVVKTEGDGKTIALFRCTQMLLYPKQ
ncbi:MAG: PaaI family thioesterase [Hyphomonadaceae bacterium]